MKKIVLTGPESSGKTTLAAQLAEHFGTVWVPEFSRQYLGQLDRSYVEADLVEIAREQIGLENEVAEQATNDLLFLDTSLEVLKVWSDVVFGRCDDWIASQLTARLPDFYLLCLPDIPWTSDPLRENPHDRDMLLTIYRREINALGVPCYEVGGSGKMRLENAANAVQEFINN